MNGYLSFVKKEALHIVRDPRTMLIVLLMRADAAFEGLMDMLPDTDWSEPLLSLFFGVFAVIFNDKFNFRTGFFANFSGNVGKYVFVAVFHDNDADFCAVTVVVKLSPHNGHADLFALFVYRFFLVVCAVARHNRLYVVPDCLYRKYDNRNSIKVSDFFNSIRTCDRCLLDVLF